MDIFFNFNRSEPIMDRVTNLISFILLILISNHSFGQVNDNFTDGNYTANPTWKGDNSKFTVNPSFELWLNAPVVTDVAFLSTPSSSMVNAEWQFYSRMDFNPSSANFCRFYLVSDQSNFNSTLTNGYFVELGRVNDEISLYRQEGTTLTKIIDGPDNMLNLVACTTRVKVTRTGNLWELLADPTGGTSFVSLGTFLDGTITETFFLGAYCKYTSTRSDKFFFDDIIATGTDWTDVVAPNITGHQVAGNILTIQLNEPVLSSDLTPVNFSLDNGLNVVSVVEDSLDAKKLTITASGNFLVDVLYHLSITSLNDLNGNTSTAINYPFIIHIASPGEIVINEFMADPSPQIGLPNAEYIELRNNSMYPVDLFQWTFHVGATIKTLPSHTIAPGGFVLIADVNDTASFSNTIEKIGISSFPGLNNSGTNIELYDSANTWMDHINYDLSWYHDAAKDDGGYSIERINPEEFCVQSYNWKASNDLNGGTPGSENSVYDTTLIAVGVNYFWIDSTHLLITFNQLMDTTGFITANFNLQNLTGVQILAEDSCILILSAPLAPNTSYTLTIDSVITDCNNLNLPAPIVVDVVNYFPQLFDLLIHELMIDETPSIMLPVSEYIEVYNTKSFPINTTGWNLVVNGDVYVLGNYFIPADSFIVLVHENNVNLFSGVNIAGIPSFGGMTNESGMVELYHSNGSLLHATPYDISYYDIAGKDDGGWSLEMVDPTKPCLRNANWTASQDPAGGSPGRRNSYSVIVNDLIKPHALKTGLGGMDTVFVYFDEGILPSSFDTTDIVLSGGMNLTGLAWESPLLDKYWIHLQDSIQMDSLYFISLQGLTDCEGNLIIADSLPFSFPIFPNNFDVIINEILSDPTTNCIDYVEIYNRGSKAIDLSQMIIGEGDTSSYILTSYTPVFSQSLLLHPGEYLYISEDHEKVMSCYPTVDSTSYWDISYLPDFTNTSGVVGISTFNQQWIDMFAYNDGMHFSALGSTDGVSLERLDPNAPTQNPMNWHSAASTVGYGTPGNKNSQFSPDIIISDDFTIDPEVFSPDNDGYKDYVTIYYQLASAGYVATLRIFDQTGRLEKVLVNNETLGTSGSFVWDGTDEKGGKVNVGIHIIYFELIGTAGEILHFKKPVVVGTKL